jgi:hypothetical protein
MLRPPAGSRKWRIAINIGGTSSVSEAFPLVCGRCRLRFTYVTPVLVKQLRVEAPGQVTFCPPWPAPGMAEDEAAELVPSGLDPGLGVFFMDLCTQQIDPSLDFDGERTGPPPRPPTFAQLTITPRADYCGQTTETSRARGPPAKLFWTSCCSASIPAGRDRAVLPICSYDLAWRISQI